MPDNAEEFIPDYADEVKDPNDPRQVLAWGLTEWPAFGKQMPMPTVKMMAPYQSEHLSALGWRHHPELAVRWKVRDPETGLAKFVDDRAEYDRLRGVGEVSPPAPTSASEMFERIQSDLDVKFADLSDEEKAARAAELEPKVRASMDFLIQLRKDMEE